MSGAAPLVATAEAPLPKGMRAYWYAGAGGARLRAAIAPASGPARGGVILSPGRTEAIEKYFEVTEELQARGFFVLIHDWRGQGLSQRLLADRHKGHAQGVGDFLHDFRRLLDGAEPLLPAPWIMLGHSMGATFNALSLAAGETRFKAAFFSAPMLGVAAARRLPGPAARLIAKAMVRAGRGAEYVAKDGFDPMLIPFEGNILTHDARRYERWRAQLRACPDLALGAPTWGWLALALDCAEQLARPSAARAADLPLTVVTAGEERLVLNAPARRYVERTPQGRHVEIAGAYHEVLMETDARRALAWREFDALIEQAGV